HRQRPRCSVRPCLDGRRREGDALPPVPRHGGLEHRPRQVTQNPASRGAGRERPSLKAQPMTFQPARTVRAFEAVLAQLRAGIADGRLRPGDRLPPTQTLARDFGVSRNAVLEALRALERSGLVTVRRGARGGAFVRALNGEELTEQLVLMMEI